jgi:hypothetical protein
MESPEFIHETARARHHERLARSMRAYGLARPRTRLACPLSRLLSWLKARRSRPAGIVLPGSAR